MSSILHTAAACPEPLTIYILLEFGPSSVVVQLILCVRVPVVRRTTRPLRFAFSDEITRTYQVDFTNRTRGGLSVDSHVFHLRKGRLRQISRLTSLEGKEVQFCLDCFVNGALNDGAILLLGPAKVGKTSFCKTFARVGLEAGRPVVYLPSDQTAEDLQTEFHEMFSRTYGHVPASENENEFRILDCHSVLAGKKPQTKYALTNLANGNCNQHSGLLWATRFRFQPLSIPIFCGLFRTNV